MALNGIDVSRYQGAIDWDQVKKAGNLICHAPGADTGRIMLTHISIKMRQPVRGLPFPLGFTGFPMPIRSRWRSGKRSTALPWQSSTRSPGLLLLIWNMIRSVTEPRTELPSGKPWRQI